MGVQGDMFESMANQIERLKGLIDKATHFEFGDKPERLSAQRNTAKSAVFFWTLTAVF